MPGSALASIGIGFMLSLMKDLDLLATPLGQLVAQGAGAANWIEAMAIVVRNDLGPVKTKSLASSSPSVHGVHLVPQHALGRR